MNPTGSLDPTTQGRGEPGSVMGRLVSAVSPIP